VVELFVQAVHVISGYSKAKKVWPRFGLAAKKYVVNSSTYVLHQSEGRVLVSRRSIGVRDSAADKKGADYLLAPAIRSPRF